MDISLNISTIIFSCFILWGIFAAAILWLRKENVLANRFLGAFLLATSLWHIDSFFKVSGIYGQNPDMYFMPIYYSLAFGPLLYFYVKSSTNRTFRMRRTDWLHFIPVIIQAILYFFLCGSDYNFKRWYWLEVHLPYTYRVEFDGTFISLAIYLILSIFLLKKYGAWLQENYSEVSKLTLNWLRIILVLLLVLCVQWFFEVILRDFYGSYYHYNYSVMLLGVLSLLLAFGALRQSSMKEVTFRNEVREKKAKNKVTIDQDVVNQIVSRMMIHQDYLEPTLTLKKFSALANLPTRQISEHINHGLHKSFNEFVNDYRVAHFKKLSHQADMTKFTLEGLAFESGFNSKATFNRIFKKHTGKTPSQYLMERGG